VRRIAAAANRLDALFRKVTSEERTAVGWSYQPLAVRPADWLGRSVEEARHLASARDLGWSWSAAEELPAVALDPQAGRDLLLELLQNAARSTPDGGEVKVEAVADTRAGRPGVRIGVRDSGVGVPAGEAAEALFEKFAVLGELSAHHSGDFEFGAAGLGLGLAMVRGTARAHGGEAWAEGYGRDPEKLPGASLCVWLPAAPATLAPEVPPQPDLPRGRLLVADPDPETRRILETALADTYEVVTAATAAAALEAWRRGDAWDACVFDPRLPDRSGAEFARALRLHPGGEGAALLCYHSGGDLPTAEALRAAGVDVCLAKPVRTRVLVQRLGALRARESLR
jgi:CheY-like chemotaxis protein